jgi:hypothetical protein
MRTATLSALLALIVAAPAPAAPKRDGPEDKAIDAALAFLATQQDSNGAWAASGRPNPAITSLAVMAFLSAGHVPGEGRYGENIEKGVRYVLKSQAGNGLLASEGGHEMYHHGICTLMLAEVAGMTDGALARDVRVAVKKAVEIILRAQRTGEPGRGGWRYTVAHQGGSDMSVTGWQIMALRAARNIGCDIPADVIDRAVAYIKRCQDPGSGGFKYDTYSGVTVPCTGTAILALELCGKDKHNSPEVLKAGDFLMRHTPRWTDFHFSYMMYYCSQATFQLGDNYWGRFRPQMHEVLLRNQKPNGSWVGNGYDGSYGANYCTAMAVLALTVEYRFLPIYQRSEEPNPKGK